MRKVVLKTPEARQRIRSLTLSREDVDVAPCCHPCLEVSYEHWRFPIAGYGYGLLFFGLGLLEGVGVGDAEGTPDFAGGCFPVTLIKSLRIHP